MLILWLLFIAVASETPHKLAQKLVQDRKTLLSGLRQSGLGTVERKLRIQLLVGAERRVMSHNSNPYKTFSMALNEFSLLTLEEKSLYLGIDNGTFNTSPSPPTPPSSPTPPVSPPVPACPLGGISAAANDEELIVDHRKLGHVTPVINQGGTRKCGSCWAISAAAAFEGSYARVTGILKSFSAKELLDCTYESGTRDGCQGGQPETAFKYIKRTGRLGNARDIPYDPYDGPCSRWEEKENGIKNAIFFGYYTRSTNLAETLRSYTPAIVYTAEDDLFPYSDGIYTGCREQKRRNHGSIMTGYANHFWEIKNSWGKNWGRDGYFRVSRIGDVCGVTSNFIYPVIFSQDRGEDDRADGDEEGLELRDVAAGRPAKLSSVHPESTEELVTEATDGNETTCFSVGPAWIPSVMISLGERSIPVNRVEIVMKKGDRSALRGSKIHIGNTGNFVDERLGVLGEPDEGSNLIVITPRDNARTIEGSKLYWEIHGEGTISACEIRVLTTASTTPTPDNNTDDCGGGLTRCPDGVCRHFHMC